MKMQKHSLRKIVSFLNNPEDDGGFWLPNIQRPFVWSEDQICRLFDSILREYPISTLLIWKTKAPIKHRKFIDNYSPALHLLDFYVPENDKKKCLVLDGQQRLQSLFIALCGSYEGRELYLDILSGEIAAPDDIKYKFAFLEKKKAEFPWIRFKDIVFHKADMMAVVEQVINKAGRALTDEERRKIGKHISIIFKTFHSDDGLSYQELDSIENSELYGEDDVVEIFIRANAGGTRLGKSDLLFSLLNASWEGADEKMDELLAGLNRSGFAFTRDFVLKSCLTILDQGARYEVSKFRKTGVREEIEQKWDAISGALKDVLDFVRSATYIQCDKALPSYLVLIPLAYARYHYPKKWKSSEGMANYLLRSLLSGVFSLTPDQLIDDIITKVKEKGGFSYDDFVDAVRSKGRSLDLTEERLWRMGYGSDTIHLLFNIWYRDFNYVPAYENNLPQIDHIFPQSELKRIKIAGSDPNRLNVIKYKQIERDQLANCMLLTKEENGPGGKTDKLPEIWFADKDVEYIEKHMIPKDPALWRIERYEEFIRERKKIIMEKFALLLVKS